MQQGEVLGLRWKDIDFEAQTIFVRQTLTQNAEIKKAGAKNEASVRSIHIPNKLVDELQTYRKQILTRKATSRAKLS